MEDRDYRELARSLRPRRRLGQNFLLDGRIAESEAVHCTGKNVVELGPGLGILTRELCKVARSVVAVEIDQLLYRMLKSSMGEPNLSVINADFFSLSGRELAGVDMLASNVPYQLSSKLLLWLTLHGIPSIVCMQEEFVNRMLAKPGTDSYSRLGVFCALRFSATKLMKVPSSAFYPVPRVESRVVYLKPLKTDVSEKDMHIISLIMEHKNKRLRNAVEDSSRMLGISKAAAREAADSLSFSQFRVSKMEPQQILESARELSRKL